MAQARRTLPQHVLELLGVIERAIIPLNVPYAIGGAVAMSAYGYRRSTDDVDLFINAEDRPIVLRAFREAGLSTSAMMAPSIYIAKFADETDPDIRIDILVPEGDPEISAIEMHGSATFLEQPLHIFSAEMIVLSKFYSERPEDHRDFQKMWEAGTFDIVEARRLLHFMDPEGGVKDFDAEILTFRNKLGRARPRRS